MKILYINQETSFDFVYIKKSFSHQRRSICPWITSLFQEIVDLDRLNLFSLSIQTKNNFSLLVIVCRQIGHIWTLFAHASHVATWPQGTNVIFDFSSIQMVQECWSELDSVFELVARMSFPFSYIRSFKGTLEYVLPLSLQCGAWCFGAWGLFPRTWQKWHIILVSKTTQCVWVWS